MIRVLIFGATGYTGVELIRILSSHPEVVIAGGSSQQWAGKQASDVFPFLHGDSDFSLSTMEELIDRPVDVAFLALPHGQSAASIRPDFTLLWWGTSRLQRYRRWRTSYRPLT